LRADQVVAVVSVQYNGADTVTVVHRSPDGHLAESLITRSDAEHLQIEETTHEWQFDSQAVHYLMALEADRIDLAAMFDRSFGAIPATFLMLLAASAATAQTGKVVYRDVTDLKRVVRIEEKDELLLARTIAIRCFVSSGTVAAMKPPEADDADVVVDVVPLRLRFLDAVDGAPSAGMVKLQAGDRTVWESGLKGRYGYPQVSNFKIQCDLN